MDQYLRDLESELGPIPEEAERAARQWADAAFGDAAASAPERPARPA